MLTKKTFQLSGAAVAIAAAGLMGCAESSPKPEVGATTDLVHCYGVNTCKGHNDCKAGENACAGKASCKGNGFVAMPSKSCADIGGKTKDEWVGKITKAELSHCHEVNVCKGHNDCKTANNACAGQASCKGQGFVAMPEKSCTNVGGKVKA